MSTSFERFYEKVDYQLYIDMDGTLTDFDDAFTRTGIYNGTMEEYEERVGAAKAWADIKKQGEKFWSEMNWFKDSKLLWAYCEKYHPTILTTTPFNNPASKTGKLKWIVRELGKDVPVLFSKNKGEHATPNRILIDDYQKKIDNWTKNGGIGILHKSTQETIQQLKNLNL